MTHKFEITEKLRRQLSKLAKKDPILAQNAKKKISEVIQTKNIYRFKNLKKPMQKYKRIHLTDNFILIFEFLEKENIIHFVAIKHRDNAYK